MTLQERIDSTERKVDEVCKQGCDTPTVRYWVGYLDGLTAILKDQNSELKNGARMERSGSGE